MTTMASQLTGNSIVCSTVIQAYIKQHTKTHSSSPCEGNPLLTGPVMPVRFRVMMSSWMLNLYRYSFLTGKRFLMSFAIKSVVFWCEFYKINTKCIFYYVVVKVCFRGYGNNMQLATTCPYDVYVWTICTTCLSDMSHISCIAMQ